MNERIKKLRRSLDLTQREFGDRIGVKGNTIAQYEIGRNEPTDSVLALLCREYGVSESWLRTGEGEMFVKLDRDDALMEWACSVLAQEDASFQKRFVSMLSKLTEKDWEVLEKMALSLVEAKEEPDD